VHENFSQDLPVVVDAASATRRLLKFMNGWALAVSDGTANQMKHGKIRIDPLLGETPPRDAILAISIYHEKIAFGDLVAERVRPAQTLFPWTRRYLCAFRSAL